MDRFVLRVFLSAFLVPIMSACNGEESAGEAGADDYPDFNLVWKDEFDGNTLDETKWTYEIGNGVNGWGNNELQYYTDYPENVFLENGELVIRAVRDATGRYTSGRIISRNKGDRTYGRITARFKLPHGRGTWPAIWMMPTNSAYGGWPRSGEVDIMEFVGYEPDVIHGTVHRSIGSGGNAFTNTIETEDSLYHIVRLDWEEDAIRWYLDDVLFHSYANAHTGKEQWPFDKDFYCIINFAVGGNWGGAKGVDATIWPQEFRIDYLRVYQRKETQ
ncbi:MAG: glycoside hydrolase family 16 protein [Tannerellaceae bacterium]|nr:glycoside hydrolase family 16 protein [Tannerellaceae bacterium]